MPLTREEQERLADLDRASPQAPAAGPLTGAVIILDYFRRHYRPVFRHGTAVRCADGREVPAGEARALAPSKLIDLLAAAVDAPQFKGGGVNRNALPSFFRTWAPTAWADLLAELPDEDEADIGAAGMTAGVEFRRLVREALLSEVVLGDVIGKSGVTQTERRSLIDWCVRFAKPGRWQSIRSKRCWSKLRTTDGGELLVMVAIRHELFAQVGADRRLRDMGSNTFGRRAQRYGVGRTSEADRPGGQRAVILEPEFVADLTAVLHTDDDPPIESPEGSSSAHARDTNRIARERQIGNLAEAQTAEGHDPGIGTR